MLLPTRRRAVAVMAGVVLTGLLILMPAARADAQDTVTCDALALSRVQAETTLVVDQRNRTYPHLTATTDYKIPSSWGPGVAALLGKPGDQNYQNALRCFLASWPVDKLPQFGEYRQQSPVLRINEAKPAANGQQATPAQIVLHDKVTGDLTSDTAPPFLWPWKATLNSDYLQLQLITKNDIPKGYEISAPTALGSMIWTAHVTLHGPHFHHLEPTPLSTDSDEEASWAPFASDKSDPLKINVELDAPARTAIASDSGPMAAVSFISDVFADAIFYVTLLVLLFRYRTDFAWILTAEGKAWRRVHGDVRAARGIAVLGFVLGIFRIAPYLWYGKDNSFNDQLMPPRYWQWSGLIGIGTVGLITLILSIWASRVPLRSRNEIINQPDSASSQARNPIITPSGSLILFQLPRLIQKSLKRWKFRCVVTSRVPLILFGPLLICYGITVLCFPQLFALTSNFSPETRPAELREINLFSGGAQLALMTWFTWAVLFVTMTVLYAIFWSMRPSSVPDTAQGLRSAPAWKFLAASFLASLALTGQWVYQQVDLWNRNHVFPAFDRDRHSLLIANVTSGMVTYYRDLFAELARSSVPWVAAAAIILLLCRLGRGTHSLQPSAAMVEYRLLGLLFAAVVVRTQSWYVGFTFRITFVAAFVIVGFILPLTHRRPWARRFTPLRTICLPHNDVTEHQTGPELLTILPKPTDLPDLLARLFDQQEEIDLLQEQARSLVANRTSGNVDSDTYKNKKREIESSLDELQFLTLTAPGEPATIPKSQSSIDRWKLPRNVRPADVALAIGPRTNWWESGVLAAKIGAFPGALATMYFSYEKTKAGKIGTLDSLLRSVVWEIGFWVIAAFVLGCLWTTLPGRRWPVKGTVLWAGFAIPFVIDFILENEIFHQGLVAEEGQGLAAGGVLGALRVLLLLCELCFVGFVFDWFTLREANRLLSYNKWKSLGTLYGIRELAPTLMEVVVPLVASLIGLYIQTKSGSGGEYHGVIILPPPAPLEGGNGTG